MKWPRLTIRRLMALVAVAGVVLGSVVWMERRAAGFRLQSDRHGRTWLALAPPGTKPSARAIYHFEMFNKYRQLGERPWLITPADPPEPK